MNTFTFHGFAMLVFAGFGIADGTEDNMCMLQGVSLIMKPPDPSDKGLVDWDKDFVTDDQSGPFYDEDAEKKPSLVPSTSSTSDPISSSPLDQFTMFVWIALALACVVLFLIFIIRWTIGQASASAGVYKMSWGVFSQAISIFCAYLIFTALKDLVRSPGRTYLLQTTLILLLALVVMAHLQLFVVRRWPLVLVGTGMIYCYTISFAIIDIVDLTAHLSSLSQANLVSRLGMLFLVVCGIVLFGAASTGLREFLGKSLRSNSQWTKICCCCLIDVDTMVNAASWNEWKNRVGKSEDQLSAVAIGYLISQAAEHAILMASPDHGNSFNFQALALVTLAFAVLSMFVGLWTSTGPSNRFSLGMLSSFLLATVWCLFHVTQWQCNGGFIGQSLGLVPKSFRASLLVALTTSCIALTLYLMICCYSLSLHTAPWSDGELSSFQAFTAAVGFALALPWVSCFTIGILELSSTLLPIVVTVPAAIIVCVLVLPIWGSRVLPQTSIGKTVEGK